MKITFVGLSSFLIESKSGDRLLLEPYCDSGNFALGIKFPKDLQADVFLVSHPDEDHSYLKHSMLRQKMDSDTQDNQSDTGIFPDFNLKGTLVREYNGDVCIAFSFTINGVRCLHLADNAQLLSDRQLKEIENIDVVFATMPKGEHNVAVDIINQLNPKVAIPSHYIPVCKGSNEPTFEEVSKEINTLFTADWMTGPHKDSEKTHSVFVTLFENAIGLKKSFNRYSEIDESHLISQRILYLKKRKSRFLEIV